VTVDVWKAMRTTQLATTVQRIMGENKILFKVTQRFEII
jgi:hypothetical protein